MGNVGNYIYSGQLPINVEPDAPETYVDSACGIGFIPLVKTGFTILAGFTLTKKGLFPPAASRGASHLSMVSWDPCHAAIGPLQVC